MKATKIFTVLITGCLVIFITGIVWSANIPEQRTPHMRMITKILEDAGCPLDENQAEKIRNIERGPDTHEQVLALLTVKQKEALENARENRFGRNGRMGRNNPEFIAKILEDAECPLDENQAEKIKNIERGPDAQEQILALLTDDQKKVLENVRGRMPMRRPQGPGNEFAWREMPGRGQQGPQGPGNDFAQGRMAWDGQRGPGNEFARGNMPGQWPQGPDNRFMQRRMPDQQRHEQGFGFAQRNRGMHDRFMRRNNPDFMAQILEDTGYPLDENQIEKIKDITPGPDSRKQVLALLTDDQKKALNDARKNRRVDRKRGRLERALKEAGYPLEEKQVEKIKKIESESQKKIQSVLSEDQQNALEDMQERMPVRGPMRR